MNWAESLFNESTLYFREAGINRLLLTITIHVDDLGCTGEQKVLDKLIHDLTVRFGGKKGLRVQKGEYQHVGMLHRILGDGTLLTGQGEYVKSSTQRPIGGAPNEVMSETGISDLRFSNGGMGYATNSRPDVMGRVAATASEVGVDVEGNQPCWRSLIRANKIVEEAQMIADEAALPDRRLSDKTPPTTCFCDWLRLTLVTDSACANAASKYTQGGWVVFLTSVEEGQQVGGVCHVLEIGCRKSSRVAKSTWAVELLSAVLGLERTEPIPA